MFVIIEGSAEIYNGVVTNTPLEVSQNARMYSIVEQN